MSSSKRTAVPCAQCGQPDAKQRCSQCMAVHYCNRKCQQKHWKKHRIDCKLAAAALKLSALDLSSTGPKGAAICWQGSVSLHSQHMPDFVAMGAALAPSLGKSPSSQTAQRIDVMDLSAVVVYTVLRMFQLDFMHAYVPFTGVVRSKDGQQVVASGSPQAAVPVFRPNNYFVRFSEAVSASVAKAASPEELHELRKVYLQLSFAGRCTAAHLAFGELLLHLASTGVSFCHGDKRIVAWASSEGYLLAAGPTVSIVHHPNLQRRKELLGFAHQRGLHAMRRQVDKDKKASQSYSIQYTQKEAPHMWITFATEDGRVYDLDLSAPQFGVDDFVHPFTLQEVKLQSDKGKGKGKGSNSSSNFNLSSPVIQVHRSTFSFDLAAVRKEVLRGMAEKQVIQKGMSIPKDAKIVGPSGKARVAAYEARMKKMFEFILPNLQNLLQVAQHPQRYMDHLFM